MSTDQNDIDRIRRAIAEGARAAKESKTPRTDEILRLHRECMSKLATPANEHVLAARVLALETELAAMRERTEKAENELAQVREALTGEDYASLPSDIPTVRMAHEIRADRGKFLHQVRDTCARAEKAEAHLVAFREDAERYRWLRNDSLVHLVSGPICVLADKWGTPLTQHPDHNPELGPASHITLDGNKLDAAIDAARRKP